MDISERLDEIERHELREEAIDDMKKAERQLEAGPELDALVAKALGWPCQVGRNHLGKGRVCYLTGERAKDLPWFYPSTDWSAAMAAAEACSLFDQFRLSHSNQYGLWHILKGNSDSVAFGETGPLAICRAILALKNS